VGINNETRVAGYSDSIWNRLRFEGATFDGRNNGFRRTHTGLRLEKATLPDFAHHRARAVCKIDYRAVPIVPPTRSATAVDGPTLSIAPE